MDQRVISTSEVREGMRINEGNREHIGFKLKQARKATEEAKGLLEAGAELTYCC